MAAAISGVQKSESRTQRSGVSDCFRLTLTPLRCVRGSASGPGAIYAWQGNSKVGQGRMEILASSPSATTIKLDFIKPFEAHNIADFTLVPQGDSTTVTWAMHGPNSYLAKLMHLFFNMDKMVGGDFERGLANLKAAAEEG